MKQETLKIEEKEYTISELKYKDVAELQDLSKSESAKKLMQLSTGISDEEYGDMGMSIGITLMQAVNKINNIEAEDFQKPAQI